MKPPPEFFRAEYRDQIALAASHARLAELHELKACAALMNSIYFDPAVNPVPNRHRSMRISEFYDRLSRIWRSA
jgi:hypothetical protein